MLEEISKKGYYWTAFHFASHYGKIKLLKYLIEVHMDHPLKFDIFNLQTAEGVSSL